MKDLLTNDQCIFIMYFAYDHGFEERGGGPEGIYYTRENDDKEYLWNDLLDWFYDFVAINRIAI